MQLKSLGETFFRQKTDLLISYPLSSVLLYTVLLTSGVLVVQPQVMSYSLRCHGQQYARLPYPSLSPKVFSSSCPLSRWCHPIISSPVISFSSCLLSSPASGSFPMSQFFASGGQSIGASALASILPLNIQGWFPLGRNGLISLLFKGFSRVFSSTTVQSINSLALSLLYGPAVTSIHDYWENHSFDYMDLGWQSNVSAL